MLDSVPHPTSSDRVRSRCTATAAQAPGRVHGIGARVRGRESLLGRGNPDTSSAFHMAAAMAIPRFESGTTPLTGGISCLDDVGRSGGRHSEPMSEALDGNSIGGLLIDVFGADMTAASSTCGTCGAVRSVAELVVYQRAPGIVVRCRTCGNILMVFVQAHSVTCVDLAGLASLSQTEPVLPKSGTRGGHCARTSEQESAEKMSTPNEGAMMQAPQGQMHPGGHLYMQTNEVRN